MSFIKKHITNSNQSVWDKLTFTLFTFPFLVQGSQLLFFCTTATNLVFVPWLETLQPRNALSKKYIMWLPKINDIHFIHQYVFFKQIQIKTIFKGQ